MPELGLFLVSAGFLDIELSPFESSSHLQLRLSLFTRFIRIFMETGVNL